jgi:iron transport multicopper oxidase
MLQPSNTHFLPPFPDAIVVNDGQGTDYPVENGKTYRFRIISFSAFASAMVYFDQHHMVTIMTDASYVQGHWSHSLRVTPAQRYDVLVHVLDNDTRNYAILISLDINRDYSNPNDFPPNAYPQNFTAQMVLKPNKPHVQTSLDTWDPSDDSNFLPLAGVSILPPSDITIQLDFNFCIIDNIPR